MKSLLLFALAWAQGTPEPPKPTKDHEWLRALVGEWTTDAECEMEPGKPPLKMKGTATGKSLGGFWTVLENRGEAFGGGPFTGLLTLGYDAEKKKYVGTWVDSMSALQWRYEGNLDAAGRVLTLDTQGPDPATGKVVKYQERIERKDKDSWTFSSSVNRDGAWVQFVKVVYTRKAS